MSDNRSLAIFAIERECELEENFDGVEEWVAMARRYCAQVGNYPPESEFRIGYRMIADYLRARICMDEQFDQPAFGIKFTEDATASLRESLKIAVDVLFAGICPEAAEWIKSELPGETYSFNVLPFVKDGRLIFTADDIADCLTFDDQHAQALWCLWAKGRQI